MIKRLVKFSAPTQKQFELLRIKNGIMLIKTPAKESAKRLQGYATIYKLRMV